LDSKWKGSFPKNEEVVLTKASPTTTTVLEIENEVEIYLQSDKSAY
jgi:hypothetical protein